MQVIFRETYWLRSWVQLQHDETDKDTLSTMSKKLEVIALEISNKTFLLFELASWSTCKTMAFSFIPPNFVIIGCIHPRM